MTLLVRFRAWRARRACRRGRHEWQQHEFRDGGVATIVIACGRDGCRAVDVDRLQQVVWNRRERRHWRKIRRRVVGGA